MRISLVLLFLVAPLFLPERSNAEDETKLLTERSSFRVSFTKSKDDEFVGQGDIDNRWEIFHPETVVNPSLSVGNCPGNELILIIFGENVYDSDKWKVFTYQKTKMDLKMGKEFVWRGEQVKIEYDPRYPSESVAYQYEGTAILIKNAEGKIVYIDGKKNVWEKNVDQLLKVKEGQVYTEDYFKGKGN